MLRFASVILLTCTVGFLACNPGERSSSDEMVSPIGAAEVADPSSNSGEHQVALDRLPAAVATAALQAVEGLVLTRAETEVEDGIPHFDVSGVADGRRYEVQVSTDGTVMEVEQGDDDDDDDDQEGEDDEDDDEDDIGSGR